MRKTAAFVLVVIVLLAGTTLPGVALQDGPPDHAGGEGGGPPDHANAGDDGSSDGDGDDGDGDDGDDGAEGENEDDDGDATDPPDAADAADATDDGDADDGDADDPTATETQDSDDAGEDPTDTVTSMLPIDDEDDSAADDSSADESAADESGETQASHGDDDPLPVLDDDDEADEEESTPTPDDDDGSSESSSRSNGTGGDDSASVEMRSNDSATVADVTDVDDGDTVEIPLQGPPTEGESVALESVAVGVGEAGPFTLTATRPTDEGVEEAAPGVPVAYFEVRTDADSVENASLTLAVDEDALPEGVQPDDVEVLRYTDGGWETTETTYDEDEDVYTAEASGFSRFAVAAPSDGPLEVTDAEVPEDRGESGEEATAVATVENTGDRQATRTFAATVDGETVATRELTLEGGESATVTFDLPADEAENGTVAVDGVEAGRLQLEKTESGGSPDSSNGDLAFGVGAAVFVLLSAVGTGLFAARHEEWDWEL